MNGWYQFNSSGGVHIPEYCVPIYSCNTDAPVWMNGTHPVITDGIVNRTACANWLGNCCYWTSTIQVKTCPLGYYVYKVIGTPGSVCSLTYCTETTNSSTTTGSECTYFLGSYSCYDPCETHIVLNEPWRSVNYTLSSSATPNCDSSMMGWYRFVGSGGVGIPETCVPINRCNTHAPVWMNGTHPVITDGIVNRTACANWGGNCCYWTSTIQVKACPLGYYVYKLIRTPGSGCSLTYCTETSNSSTTTGSDCTDSLGSSSCSDPCVNRTVLNEPWRSGNNTLSSTPNCDYSMNGWYQFIGSGGVHIPEYCVPERRCNTNIPVWMNGTHPVITDGIVNRTACGDWNGNCCQWTSTIQVKACPLGYYVYKLIGTPGSMCSLSYCTGINIECGMNQITVSYSKCYIELLGFNTSSLHLADSKCTGVIKISDKRYITVTTLPMSAYCGTELMVNSSYLTYTNVVYLSSIVTSLTYFTNISCIYPRSMKNVLWFSTMRI
ncbi:hypothetical protein AB205_0015570, partial [Aquarana catesbeiana]